MANRGIVGMQRNLRELKAIRDGLSDVAAKQQVREAIVRVETNIGKRAARIGRKPRMKKKATA